jgi:hypothetical protein
VQLFRAGSGTGSKTFENQAGSGSEKRLGKSEPDFLKIVLDRQRWSIVKHMWGRKPYWRKECSRSFTHPSNLKRHMPIHTAWMRNVRYVLDHLPEKPIYRRTWEDTLERNFSDVLHVENRLAHMAICKSTFRLTLVWNLSNVSNVFRLFRVLVCKILREDKVVRMLCM